MIPRFGAVVAGVALWLAAPAAAGSACCHVEVYADLFVPGERVVAPLAPNFGPPPSSPVEPEVPETFSHHQLEGDARSGFERGASARLWSRVRVDLCTGAIESGHGAAAEVGYRWRAERNEDVPEGTDGAWVRKELRETARADVRGQERGMRETVSVEDGRATIEIEAEVPSLLVENAPAFNYRWKIRVFEDTGKLAYQASGDHDGFPAYSLFVGDELVYSYSPDADEASAWSLVGTGKHHPRRASYAACVQAPVPEGG